MKVKWAKNEWGRLPIRGDKSPSGNGQQVEMRMDFTDRGFGEKRSLPLLIFCAGGGRMGTRGAEAAKALGACIVVADPAPNCLARSRADVVLEKTSDVDPKLDGKIQLVPTDAVECLLELMEKSLPQLIVPATEGHFAARLAVAHLARRNVMAVPCTKLLKKVAAAFPPEVVLLADEKNAVLVTSYMPSGIMCQDDCAQPALCSVLGRKRERPMHQLMEERFSEEIGRSAVLITNDLGGVGVLQGDEVQCLLAQMDSMVKGDVFALATSCRCHGIANFLLII